jgi:hypothetical protein
MVVDSPIQIDVSVPALATGTGRTSKVVIAVSVLHSFSIIKVMVCCPTVLNVTDGFGAVEEVGVPVGKLQS